MKKNKKSFLGNFIVLLILIAFVFFGANSLSYANTLKFAQISDVHLSNKTIDTSYKVLSSSKPLFEDVISQINKQKDLDFVIETGDLLDKPKKKLLDYACEQLNQLKYPWYFAFGNHDAAVGSEFKKDKYFDFIQKHNKNMNFEKPYYSFIPKQGFRVIVLDATVDTKVTSNGELPQEQLKWLNSQLIEAEKANQLPLIFLHHPLHEPFPSFHHRIINAKEFKDVLDSHKIPMAIFTGHYHATRVYKEGHILHVSTPSLVTYPCAFRIIKIDNKKDKVVFDISLKETNLKDVQKKAKIMTFSSSTYKGEESDQNTVVVLDK